MAGSTRFLGMAFFDFGDDLDSPLNIEREVNRFVLIDKQLYGLYQVFGDGVIDGWRIEDNGFSSNAGISIDVGPGIGIIRSIAAETTFPVTLEGLPPNSNLNVYALLQGSTVRDRVVDFAVNSDDLGDFAIKVANVITGASSILSINNNDRDRIGFREIIEEEINQHKHRGNPSKIDLQQETKNRLPGARIEGISTENIDSGILDKERIPAMNHDDLNFSGLLSHSQLDSFVQTLGEQNKELLGEVTTTNLLKQIVFLKYQYEDVDKDFINELALIPGISPNEFIDFDSTDAHIELEEHCISGKPPSNGEFIDVNFSTNFDFLNAFSSNNIQVDNHQVRLARDDESFQVVEGFESVSGGNEAIPGYTSQIIVSSDETDLTSENVDSLVLDGFYSGHFESDVGFNVVFSKSFTSPQNWSNFDELVVPVKAISDSHGSVWMYFESFDRESNEDIKSEEFLILSQNEITDNDNDQMNDFEEKRFSIENEDRRCVNRIVIFTDDVNDFEFYLDNIRVVSSADYVNQGQFKLRHSSNTSLVFHSIFYDADLPEDADVRVRAKSASSQALLSRAQYTANMPSGTVFAHAGTNIEIEVTLLTNDVTVTPVLNNLTLRLLVESENHGFSIDSEDDWSRGEGRNIEVNSLGSGDAQIRLQDPINVDGLYFSLTDFISEINDNDGPVLGFSGPSMPISPRQAKNWHEEPFRKFEQPVGVFRKETKNFLVADRDNNRIIETDSRGGFVRGVGSYPKETEENFWPMSATYNPNNKLLSIILSDSVEKSSVNINGVFVSLGSTRIQLSDSSDTLYDVEKSNRILEIVLSDSKASQLNSTSNNIYVDFSENAFPADIEVPIESQGLYGINGLPVFKGEFTWVTFIDRPIDIIELNNNWIVANSTIRQPTIEDITEASEEDSGGEQEGQGQFGQDQSDQDGPPSLIEISPEDPNEPVLEYNDVVFSDVSLGGVSHYNGNRIAIAALVGTDNAVAPRESENIENTISKTIEFVVEDEEGNPVDAESVTLSSPENNDPQFGVVRNDENEVVVDTGAEVDKVGTGRYQYTFDARLGISYTWSWRVVRTEGSEPEFHQTTRIIDGSESGDGNILAQATLLNYRGTVLILDKSTSQVLLRYNSPDGMYPSDVDIFDDGTLLVAESNFTGSSGRLIRLDTTNNIIWQHGRGEYGVINDINIRKNNNIVLST